MSAIIAECRNCDHFSDNLASERQERELMERLIPGPSLLKDETHPDEFIAQWNTLLQTAQKSLDAAISILHKQVYNAKGQRT